MYSADGGTADVWVGFMLGACAVCPQSCCLGCFPGSAAGPLICDVPDVIEAIQYGEWASQENGPPRMWDWEQLWDGVPVAIRGWGRNTSFLLLLMVCSVAGALV